MRSSFSDTLRWLSMLVRAISLLIRLDSTIPRADSKLALLDCLRAGGGGGGEASETCDVDLARPWTAAVSGFGAAVAASGLITFAVLPVRRVGGGGGPIFWEVELSAMLGG